MHVSILLTLSDVVSTAWMQSQKSPMQASPCPELTLLLIQLMCVSAVL